MRPPEPLPRLARWLLGWRRLGERRAEVEGDLLDVYGSRCASHEASVYGVSPTDPLAVGFAVGLLVVSATAASILPAERAAHLDPARVLRQS